jgi:DNA-binding XRE family transcriptional regulator
MDAKLFGKKIKMARVELDMTQTDLANKIGANQKSVSRYENGLSTPELETMEKIAKTLKKSIDYFLD